MLDRHVLEPVCGRGCAGFEDFVWQIIMTVEPIPNDPEPRGGSHQGEVSGEPARSAGAVPERSPHRLLDQARQRFKELASACVQRCELKPEMARTVLHSLELGFAQMIKEDGRLMQRQFGQDVEAAVTWAAERHVEASRRLAADTPGQKTSPLQSLALLEVQALEMMLPEPSQTDSVEPKDVSVPAAQLKSFCALLNEGLDFAQKADAAADSGNQHAYQGNYVLSRNKLRRAGRTLRRMLSGARPVTSDVSAGLRDLQIELAAYTGSIRTFLKALSARHMAAPSPRHHVLDPHCAVGDLLATLFDRHFAFNILTPRGTPPDKAQELVTAAHELMWQKIEGPVSALLAQPDKLRPMEFKDAVEIELRKAIKEVIQQFAPERVTISISSNNVKDIRRREWQ